MPKDNFDAKEALKKIEQANEGVKFDEKVRDAIVRSTHIQMAIKEVFWNAVKEKLPWTISVVIVYALARAIEEFLTALIEKI